jgi:hypothetical protein
MHGAFLIDTPYSYSSAALSWLVIKNDGRKYDGAVAQASVEIFRKIQQQIWLYLEHDEGKQVFYHR